MVCGGSVYVVWVVYILVWFLDGLVCSVCRFEGLPPLGGGFVGVVGPWPPLYRV